MSDDMGLSIFIFAVVVAALARAWRSASKDADRRLRAHPSLKPYPGEEPFMSVGEKRALLSREASKQFRQLVPSPEQLKKRSSEIVPSCQVIAAGLIGPMQERFPVVLEIPIPLWERVVTVAHVCHAVAVLKQFNISRELHLELVNNVLDHLRVVDARGVEALQALNECTHAERIRLQKIPPVASDHKLLRNLAFGTCTGHALVKQLPPGQSGVDFVAALGNAICESTVDIWNA